MEKGFTTFRVIQGKEPLLRRLVCEIRYEDGQLYLDHSGRLLKQLTRNAPEWVVASSPSPQGTTVYNVRMGTQLSFSMVSASLSLDKTVTDEVIAQEETDSFIEQIESVFGLVLDELEVTQFSRIGFREFYYFSFESKEASEKWVRELGLVTVKPDLYQEFAATPDILGFAIVMQGSECNYRIGVNGIERAAQIPFGETFLTVQTSATRGGQWKELRDSLKKQRQRQINAAFSVVLDIDVFLHSPPQPDIKSPQPDIKNFLQQHAKGNLEKIRETLNPTKKGK